MRLAKILWYFLFLLFKLAPSTIFLQKLISLFTTFLLKLHISFNLWSLNSLSENIHVLEYLSGRYKDLTWVKHKHSLQYAPNHESLDIFRGFQTSVVWARDGYTSKHFTSEILWKSLGIHNLEHCEWSVYASIKWDLCSVRVNVQSYVYFAWHY